MKKKKWLTGSLAALFTCATLLQPALALGATSLSTVASANAYTRLAGQDRYETAAKIAEQGWKTSSDYAILAAGMDANLVDALTAAPLAKAKNAPILLTEGTSLNAFAASELTRLQVKTVYVTSGSGVIQKAVTDKLAQMGMTVKPLGGSDRFATAVNIAKELGSVQPFSKAVVATAYSNADALSIASIAATEGMPILLTDVASLTTTTATYLNSIKASLKNTYVIGGTGVVSDGVKAALPNATRTGGLDRYETNRLVLTAFVKDLKYGQVFVANGENAHLVDALAAAPLAAQTASPLVLGGVQVPSDTLNYVKANLLPRAVTALGGEAVVGSTGLTAMTSSQEYAASGAIQGSSDAANQSVLTDNLLVTGDNVTVQNTIAPYSLYVSGNNSTLKNLNITGTLFLDPGATGTATVDNVTAKRIVVLSGATGSIHLNNVNAGTLTVDSSSNVRVETRGTTTIATTLVASPVILDAASGNLGAVTVVRSIVPGGTVELRGTFTQPVVVEAAAAITAAAGASIAQLSIAPTVADAQVTLAGSFAAVTVDSQAAVVLADNTVVTTMTTNAQALVTVPPTASVTTFTDSGSTGTLVGGGGTVNNQTTTTTLTAPPPATTTPPVAGGGGSSVPAAGITTFSITTASGSIPGTVTSSTLGTVDLSNATTYYNDYRITGIALSVPTGSSMTITQINSPKNGTITLSKSVSSASAITVSELLGGLINGGDISVGSMRALFGNTVTFTGSLACSGYTTSSVNMTINLGSTASSLNNDYATMVEDDINKVITATIKPGMGGSLLSTMGLYNLLNMAGQIPSYVTVNSSDWTTSSNGGDPITSSGRIAIQDAIATQLAGTTWSSATLGQLSGKTIYFKKYGDTTPYSLTIN